MKNQDILENNNKIAFLSIGSNLGNKKKNIELAKIKLELNNIKIIKVSKFYESLSWPNTNNPKFINISLMVQTKLSPRKLMEKCLYIEKQLGRRRRFKNSPRTCDIDIIDYNGKKLNNAFLISPHPKMHKRNFVLLPLFEISSNWVHPVKKISINKLINSLDVENLRSIKLI